MPGAIVSPKDVPDVGPPPPTNPPAELVPFTCPWAQDGLRKALDGMAGVSEGVDEYKIGTRAVKYRTPADQAKAVDYWNQMVVTYCGVAGLPTSLTGRDTARRVVPRDL